MATIKTYLDKRRKDADGLFRVTLTVSHRSQTVMIPLGFKMTEGEWNAIESSIKYEPRNKWNKRTDEIFSAGALYEAALSTLSRQEDLSEMSARQIKDRLEEIVKGESSRARRAKTSRKTYLIDYYRQFASTRPKKGTQGLYEYTLNKILAFEPDAEHLTFEQVDKAWLTEFDVFLRDTNCPNIRNMHFRNLRAVFNAALDDEVTQNYPFRKFKLPKIEETRKRALTVEQLRELRDYPCMDWMKEYRDMFMLMFYLVGINSVDLFTAKKEDVVNGRLEYRREKTGKLYSIKIEPEAQEIIDRYAGKDWLLSPLDRYASYRDYVAHLNRGLQHIGMTSSSGRKYEGTALFPGLSTYWSRHSWASVASRLDIPMEIIGRALGHSWVTDTTTAIYIDFDTRKIDEANRKVIDAVVNDHN